MSEYLVPGPFGEAEFVQKRSRFIGRVWRVSTEEEALGRISEMRRQHWDATHNVYAYSIKDGPVRFSDDGEPSGTSGLPTLDVFRKGEVFDVCCVVTRYFGGILLGGGGLVRAYSHTAKLALDAAGLYAMRSLEKMKMTCPYGLFEKIRQETERWGDLEDAEYGADVVVRIVLPEDKATDFTERITDITSGLVCPVSCGSEQRPVGI